MNEANLTSTTQKTETYCKVCGDKASGKHYGVASCDGCRGFFKRSIRRNLEYVCKESGRCIVDVTRRNQCQACRFKKCLQVNMKRDAVQHERAPRTTQPALHPHYPLIGSRLRQVGGLFTGVPMQLQAPLVDHSVVSPTLAGHYLQQGFLFQGMLANYPKSTLMTGGDYLHFQGKGDPALLGNLKSGFTVNKDDEVVTSSEETKNGEGCRPTFRPLDLNCLSLFPAENVYESAAKLLFLAVKWARTIPSFLQLSYRDQSVLLEESWSELFVLTAAQWTLPVDEVLLVSNAMAPTSRHTALEDDARKLRDVITRLTLLRVDHTEYACLKALVLFKSECRGLCEPSHVELLQDQTHVMLHEYCAQKAGAFKGRFGKLLLALPAVQAVTRRGLEELLFRQTVGDVAIDRLLGEMTKATHS